MDPNLIDRIRERAYQIWFAGGCHDGEAEQHWLAAEREILQAVSAVPPAKPAVAKVAKKVRRPFGRAARAAAQLVN
jgi:hypothetical protein